jgi:hypothetical protein
MLNQMLGLILLYQNYGRQSESGGERMLIGALSAGLFYLIAAAVRGVKKNVKGKDFEKID